MKGVVWSETGLKMFRKIPRLVILLLTKPYKLWKLAAKHSRLCFKTKRYLSTGNFILGKSTKDFPHSSCEYKLEQSSRNERFSCIKKLESHETDSVDFSSKMFWLKDWQKGKNKHHALQVRLRYVNKTLVRLYKSLMLFNYSYYVVEKCWF